MTLIPRRRRCFARTSESSIRTAAAARMTVPVVESMEERVLFATFVVTTTANDGGGSLRDAMRKANASSDSDLIQIKIGTGAKTITPLSPLPHLKYPTSIDGTTQGGYAGKPLV